MSVILGVRFREIGKIHYLLCPKNDVSVGDSVIAETKKGVECGKVLVLNKNINFKEEALAGEKFLRKATLEDLKSLELKKKEEKKAEEICKKKILNHKLKMKLIDVEYTFNRSKVIFYFVSESRVDFRSLVKDLAYVFKIRIELRQVGIRDEAKILGGLGSCGKPLCCSSFLKDFQSVSIKMAKDQGVSLNPTKLSGVCGRLMCCLKYEQDTYLNSLQNMPQINDKVITPQGEGVVTSLNVLKDSFKVLLPEGTVATVKATGSEKKNNFCKIQPR